MNRYTTRHGLVIGLLSALLGLSACSETGHFREQVNQATQNEVARRYGWPHRIDPMPDGGSAWIYFDRGSGTSSYSGSAKSSYCHAYILMFDEPGVLRDWREEDCAGRTLPPTVPSSDRK